MRTIWKFPVKSGRFSLDMPAGAQHLSVQLQNGEPHLWSLVDTRCVIISYDFDVFGTGFEISDGLPGDRKEYIGTFQIDDNGYNTVWHLFLLN